MTAAAQAEAADAAAQQQQQQQPLSNVQSALAGLALSSFVGSILAAALLQLVAGWLLLTAPGSPWTWSLLATLVSCWTEGSRRKPPSCSNAPTPCPPPPAHPHRCCSTCGRCQLGGSAARSAPTAAPPRRATLAQHASWCRTAQCSIGIGPTLWVRVGALEGLWGLGAPTRAHTDSAATHNGVPRGPCRPPRHYPGLEPHSALPTAMPTCFGLPCRVLPEGLRGRTHGLASSIVSARA
jgi:hypothetical protein